MIRMRLSFRLLLAFAVTLAVTAASFAQSSPQARREELAKVQEMLRAYPSRNVCSGPPPIWDGEKDFMEAPEAVCSG
jgi:hypothetical protein